jgi:Glycosyl transferase family 11
VVGVQGVRNSRTLEQPIALYRKFRPHYRRFVQPGPFQFVPAARALPDNVCLVGFWISEKYFADVEPIIRAEFAVRAPPSPKNAKCIQEMADCKSVAVHVRRGDYVTKSTPHGVLDIAYYHRAVEAMRERVSDPLFYVFSDDLDWARAFKARFGLSIRIEAPPAAKTCDS